MRAPAAAAVAALALLAACGSRGRDEASAAGNGQGPAEPQTVDVPQTVTSVAPGTTPMAERVAILGFLNKRNGLSHDLTLKPGQAVRVGDAIVRLRACETSAPWEVQKLTGAFVQLDVRNPQGEWHRVFSGWLYKESPSLNVVEHPIYDVWPKSCAMTHPEGAEASPPAASSSNRSSARKSGGTAEAPSGTAADKAESNKVR
jgi:hypothetical protein